MRGVALLRVGGRLVYSTCLLNPVEDEAVVGEILRQNGRCMELLDVSSDIPGLKFRPGLKSWKVRDIRKWLCSNSQVDRHRAGVVVPSMFPSGKGWDMSVNLDSNVVNTDSASENIGGETVQDGSVQEENAQEENEDELVVDELEVSSLPLERCMRILPHDQNTGGFFIAVFRKNSTYKVQQQVGGKKDKAVKYQPKKDKAIVVSTQEDCGPTPVEDLTVEELGPSEIEAIVVDKTTATSDDVEATDSGGPRYPARGRCC